MLSFDILSLTYPVYISYSTDISFNQTTDLELTSSVNISNLIAGTKYYIKSGISSSYYSCINNITLLKLNQEITFNNLYTNYFYNTATFDISASSTSGLSVDLSSSNTSILDISGIRAIINGQGGPVTITGTQYGNETYYSTQNSTSITILPPLIFPTLTINCPYNPNYTTLSDYITEDILNNLQDPSY